MKSLEYEREILATDEQEVGRRDDGVNDVVVGARDGMQRVTQEVVNAVGVKGKDVGSVVRDAVDEVGGVKELENALKCMADMELKNKAYEGTISKLEDEVVSLKSKMEMQAVNIVGGFGCVVKVKDDEIRKLENENKELRKTISMLEDQLADQQVHTVTQAYRMNTPTGCRDVGASHCDGGHTVARRSVAEKSWIDAVVDVDIVVWLVNGPVLTNNRFGVWKMMTYEEGENYEGLRTEWRQGCHVGDGESGVVCVFLTPRVLSVEKVIDAYAETLVTEQAKVCADDVLADKSYFFSSICMSVFKSGNNQAIESYKERVSFVMKRSLRADGIDEVSIAETFNHHLG
ncbi:hypothetical protein LOK49_LG09G02085 [Camellia lanceoleosa]|uniref:Uncharacterized protein n=1 Tax=Camellia lanceoleosa TaxID=1840588 RepID=A0ACC0GMN2_9ERIC|nr:hypothetical protein LOK49_LG09G02085 [Camellia lanceoleosa]